MTTFVLLHAFPLDGTMYDSVRRRLDFDVLTPNLAGFGSAPLSTQAPSLEVYAQEVMATLDADGVSEFVLGGTSMGGYIAMVMLRRWPARVRGLALIDTKASADSPEAVAGREALADQLVATGSARPLIDAVLPKLLGPSTTANQPVLARQLRDSVERVDSASAAWAQRAMAARTESFDALKAARVPAVVIVGDEDVLAPPTDAQAMVDVMPSAELVVIEGAGHLTPLESPDHVATALTALKNRI